MGMDNLVSSHDSTDADIRRRKRLKSANKELARDPAGIKKAQADSINDSKRLSEKRKAKSSTPAPKQEAKSSPVDSSATSSFDTKAAGKGAAESMAGGGSAMDTVSSGLMMSGNPYAMAAGAALKVVGGVQKKKEAQAKMQADAENQRRARLQDALSRLGSGVGSLGMA